MIPVSIEAKARQKSQLENQSTRLGLAAVGRYTGGVIADAIGPLEILANLLFLASETPDPEKAREYLREAQVHLRTVSDINLDILRFCVKHSGDLEEPAESSLRPTA